jgi:hypothetical protein
MYFPWAGMLEQLRLADVFVHLDDAQYSKGGFTNRVQVKTAAGFSWMSVPVGVKLGMPILEVMEDAGTDWRSRHLALLEGAYAGAPFRGEMLALAGQVLAEARGSIADISIRSLEALAACFLPGPGPRFVRSSALALAGSSSQRVLDLVRHFEGKVYVTGHGARHYLDHQLFEDAGVQVRYLDYRRKPYPQLHGPFNPHVSALDLLANAGPAGREVLCSDSVYWKEFLKQ